MNKVFCSALPVAYGRWPQPLWLDFAQWVLDAAYEATLLAGVLSSRQGDSHIMVMRFSLGAVSQAHGLVSRALEQPVAQLHAELQHAPVCHADETRHQSHRHTLWVRVRASDWGVRFRIDPSRGQAAAQLILGGQPSFIMVSDR